MPGKIGRALAQSRYQVVAQFVLHAARSQARFGEWTVAQFAERPRKTHDRNPQEKLRCHDYTPLACILRCGAAYTANRKFTKYSAVMKAECRLKRHGHCRRPLPHLNTAAHCGKNGFKVRNDGSQRSRLRFHAQQRLLEVEIKRKRTSQVERKLVFGDSASSGCAPARVMISACSFMLARFPPAVAPPGSSCR